MSNVVSPDDPTFFDGTDDDILKRVNVYLASLGSKYGEAEHTVFKEWEALKYERIIVSPEEWLNSPEYVGATGEKTYEVVKEEFYRIFNKDPRPMQVILKGSIGWGKTFLSALIMARLLYELSCYRNPQAYFGLSPESRIVLMNMSVTKTHARKVMYKLLMEIMDSSQYFSEVFPRRMTLTHYIDFPQKKIAFVPGSSSELSALGENLFGGVIEEANFFPVVKGSRRSVHPDEKEFDAAKHLQNAIWRRMKSRYQSLGKVPGMLVLNSSARFPDDYLERLAKESDPAETLIVEHSEWETKPPEKYSGKKFLVFLGDEHSMPKILEKEADTLEYAPRGEIIDIPVEYKKDFDRDLLGALRDIAGKNIKMINRFFPDDEMIDLMFKKGEALPKCFGDRYDRGVPCDVLNDVVEPVRLCINHPGHDGLRPKVNPGSARFLHIDLSATGDCTGFVMCHVAEVREVEKVFESDSGEMETLLENVPEIVVDLALRIVPPLRGEIDFSEIRKLIHRFVDCGFRFSAITFDQWQSKDSQQILAKKYGEDVVFPLSVDRTMGPYLLLKEALTEKRISCGFYSPLSVELRNLVKMEKKVDHPPGGAKDTSDGLAGCVYTASKGFDASFIDEWQWGVFEEEGPETKNYQDDFVRRLMGYDKAERLEQEAVARTRKVVGEFSTVRRR